jgi:hypothetical protein
MTYQALTSSSSSPSILPADLHLDISPLLQLHRRHYPTESDGTGWSSLERGIHLPAIASSSAIASQRRRMGDGGSRASTSADPHPMTYPRRVKLSDGKRRNPVERDKLPMFVNRALSILSSSCPNFSRGGPMAMKCIARWKPVTRLHRCPSTT